MEDKTVMDLAAIDLNAAFDTVYHDILLNVLGANFGIRRVGRNRITLYLFAGCHTKFSRHSWKCR